MPLLAHVRRFAQRHAMWHAETRVIAAVSGGSDSVALLLLLHDLHIRSDVMLDAVAHLNHGIRADADEDEEFCRALAAQIGLPFVSTRIDVPALARRTRQSIEVAARGARGRFLEDVRRSRGADRIATGHTQDDQAETVMLRLLRGSGRRGLSAIGPTRGPLIRPVLWASREELRKELQRRGHSWREDSTNADLDNPRNRVRRELLPYLERHFNPSARVALARAADLARSDEQLLTRDAVAAAVHLLHVSDGSARIDRDGLTAAPDAVARRVVLYALSSVQPQTSAALDHVEAVLSVAHRRRAAADLPGMRVEHSGGSVVLVRKDLARQPATFRADLPIPGEIQLPEIGVVVEAGGPFESLAPGAWDLEPGACGLEAGARGLAAGARGLEPGARGLAPDSVRVSADELGGTLVVRSRRPGDRLRPLGLGGTKKLQDLFVDRKVSRTDRDRVPIVTDEQGRIVWVAGHAIGEEFRVTDRTNAVIILKLRRISRVGVRRESAPDP